LPTDHGCQTARWAAARGDVARLSKHGAHLASGGQHRRRYWIIQRAQHVDLGKLPAGSEAVLRQEGDPRGVVLPGAGNERAAPALRVSPPELSQAHSRPIQHFGFDAAPFILGPQLPINGRIFAQDRETDQPACGIMPQPDALPWLQVAGHHEEVPHQLADVRMAPVISGGARCHEQVVHLPQVMLGFVVAGGQHGHARPQNAIWLAGMTLAPAAPSLRFHSSINGAASLL
jgi:hypothetical protein